MHPLRSDRLRAVQVLADLPEARRARAQGEPLPILRVRAVADPEVELRRIKWKLHRFFTALWP